MILNKYVSYDPTHLIHLCSRIHVSYGCLLKHDLACIFRVSPIETFREKSNHTIDDEDKKTDPVGLAVSAFFAVRKYLVFADVISEGTRYKKHRCQAPML